MEVDEIFAGSSETAALMRELDWTATALGPVASWPQTLRTVIPIMLASRFAMRVVWGERYVMLYNDAYLPVLGGEKHPRTMGNPTADSFPELWHIVEPMFRRVYQGEAVAMEDGHLPLHRNGYLEECYFTLSYSPMRDDTGTIAGVLGVIHETTDRVLAERRLRTLRGLAAHAASCSGRSVEEAGTGALAALGENIGDVAFAMLYLGDGDGLRRVATVRVGAESPAAPPRLGPDGPWPLDGDLRVVPLGAELGAFGGGSWPEPSTQAVVVSLLRHHLQGYLIIGLSPRRAWDAGYADFCALAASQLTVAIDMARTAEAERTHARRAQLRAEVATAFTVDLPWEAQLQRCVEAVRIGTDARVAGIWTVATDGGCRLAAATSDVSALAAAVTAVVRGAPVDGGIIALRLLAEERLVGVLAVDAPPGAAEALASIVDTIALGVEREQDERERAELLLREQRALAEAERQRVRLSSVFMQAPAGICVLRGADHVFELANARYIELVGDREIVGKPLVEALPETAPAVLSLLDGVLASGEPFFGNEFPVAIARRGVPEERFFNFIYQPIFDDRQRAEGIAVVAFDVTDQVLARQRAERLARALEVSNQDLDQFAYVASHDLKAPLRGIASLSEWIEEALQDHMTDDTRRQMGLMRGRVHRLEALIDGILDYSRAGRMREKLERVDVAALLAETRDLLAPKPPATIAVVGEMPIVETERVPMQQVFMNLISNALKHAGRPDAHVEIACATLGDSYDFTVRDNGPGIPEQYRDRIWGIFQTLQPRDKVEGTGIGLSVVKRIVESRGGRVSIDSEVGVGSTFHAIWPKRAKELL